MATVFSNVNIAHMNGKQLRTIARTVNVSPAVINTSIVNNNVQARKAALISAIKAK